MRETRAKMSKHNDLSVAIDYMLRRWDGFTLFLRDGTVCLTNNAAERALRRIACGRKSWMFCGSDRGGQRAAVMYSLIATCRMNNVDPEAWLRDVLARLPGASGQQARSTPAVELGEGQTGYGYRSLSMAAPYHVYTIEVAAKTLGVSVDLLDELAMTMTPEDGIPLGA